MWPIILYSAFTGSKGGVSWGRQEALVPGILRYFLFLTVIMEGDLDMETFLFFLFG